MDLSKSDPVVNLWAMLYMLLHWGRDEGAQERYRNHFKPRWMKSDA